MTHGPDRIVQLPDSQSLVRLGTLASGNTFGATRWTDAYTDAPMLPHQPPLRVHPVTGEIFLVAKCKSISEDADSEPDQWQDVPCADDPATQHYLRALAEGLGDSTKLERELRICLWWLHNDRVRESGALTVAPEEFRANLAALHRLI